ncbi:hypothetical protein Nepgr_005088 [Nepenthes gracilis]|uniref:Uncharacterized protein n=1 Tax=Nepenthes gracilis TaxID=150966 RepID=A0AAD3S308_NEPGR|nr:hypothetical protein Nepgr_005088 [Nepenthes gracilis]
MESLKVFGWKFGCLHRPPREVRRLVKSSPVHSVNCCPRSEATQKKIKDRGKMICTGWFLCTIDMIAG